MNGELLPRSRVIRVQLEIVLPVAATREQVLEWVKHEFERSGGIGDDNPLHADEPDVIREPILSDTGMHHWVEVRDLQKEGGTSTMKILHRFSEEPADLSATLTVSDAVHQSLTPEPPPPTPSA